MKDIQEKKIYIIQVVRDLVLDNGLQDTSMSMISKATKVPVGTIYNLFPSKENLINEVYLYCRNSFYDLSVLSEMQEGRDFETNFKCFVRRYIMSVLQNDRSYLFVEQYHLSPVIDRSLISNPNIGIGGITLEEAMEQGLIRRQKPELMSNMLMGMVHQCLNGHLTGVYPLDDAAVEAIADTCWRAVKI